MDGLRRDSSVRLQFSTTRASWQGRAKDSMDPCPERITWRTAYPVQRAEMHHVRAALARTGRPQVLAQAGCFCAPMPGGRFGFYPAQNLTRCNLIPVMHPA